MRQWDIRELDAGDARRLNDQPAPETIVVIRPSDLTGDLNTSAGRLGVDVADLVRARRALGIQHTHRAPGLLARITARLIRPRPS